MNRETSEKKEIPIKNKVRKAMGITVLSDVVLLVIFIFFLLSYISINNKSIYNRNVENISGIAASNSQLVQSVLDKSRFEVKRAYNFCNGKKLPEILSYLSTISNANEEYQLLKEDSIATTDIFHVYKGFSTKQADGEYLPVEYRNTSLSSSIFSFSKEKEGEVFFSQSFTNNTDALRYFASVCNLKIPEEGALCSYYLVRLFRESELLDMMQRNRKESGIAIAICYSDGKYLANDSGYRGDNFFDYLYKYNNLSADEKNEIRNEVKQNKDGSGVLTFLNYQKQKSVFSYNSCGEENDLIVIVAEPVSAFPSEQLLSSFPVSIISFLIVLLLFNIWRLLLLVSELKQSVSRELKANASKSSFLSRMSHEIRTPLNAVIGYNSIAKNSLNGAEKEEDRRQAEMKVMDCLTKSEIASKHLLTVINDVLDMSAIDSGKINISKESFDFRGMITSLTTVFYSQARSKNVDFEVIFNSLTEEWFIGDQMRVNQILTNLLSNAIKFTSNGGSVKLNITQPDAASDASHIHFEVKDTGIGMTEEYISHIFTPFEQADSTISRRFGGSGLGLSITKNLVDLMGGTITVESTQGVGTTFKVDLTFDRMEQPKKTGVYDFANVNALVVDDDVSTCEYIRLLFNRCGARCAAVTSGQDALLALQLSIEQSSPYSVCLVDWRMPQMDGIETIKRIRQLAGQDIPIIVLTAYDYAELADQATQIGVNRFISKPLFQSSLFDLLANISGLSPESFQSNEDSVDFKGARVLLAEDNAMNMEIACSILTAAGLTLDKAWNGREAVNRFMEAEPGTYKVILMDVHMPEVTGHQATQEIRNSGRSDAKTIPIIAMTADAFAENVAEAYNSGMNAHVSKPIDIPALYDLLKKYI